MEIELLTPKTNDTERREVNPEGFISQYNSSTENHNEIVKDEFFETAMGAITRKSINTNTNNRIRSTKIPAPKLATQQKRDTLVGTSERSEGDEFPNRSTASTSQNFTEQRYQTRIALGITRARKLKDYFLFKENDSDENFDNDVFL